MRQPKLKLPHKISLLKNKQPDCNRIRSMHAKRKRLRKLKLTPLKLPQLLLNLSLAEKLPQLLNLSLAKPRRRKVKVENLKKRTRTFLIIDQFIYFKA